MNLSGPTIVATVLLAVFVGAMAILDIDKTFTFCLGLLIGGVLAKLWIFDIHLNGKSK